MSARMRWRLLGVHDGCDDLCGSGGIVVTSSNAIHVNSGLLLEYHPSADALGPTVRPLEPRD